MDTIADFMAYNHFDGVRAHHSLLCMQLVHHCSTTILCPQIIYLITKLTRPTRFNSCFDLWSYSALQTREHLRVVAASGTISDAALLCSSCSDSTIISSSIVLPLNLLRETPSRKICHYGRQTLLPLVLWRKDYPVSTLG